MNEPYIAKKDCGNTDLDLFKLWTITREAIAHEDNLCNHRLNWLIAGHTFLYLAIGNVLSAMNKPTAEQMPNANRIVFACITMLLVATIVAWIIFVSVRMAVTQVSLLRKNWNDALGIDTDSSRVILIGDLSILPNNCSTLTPWPPICGNFKVRVGHEYIPIFFLIGDILLIAICMSMTSLFR
jgi:hypothetical protein